MAGHYLQGTTLGILAGARFLRRAVLGGQAGALLQLCQQSICKETPGSGPTATACPPWGLVPLPECQEQKECHSRSCWPPASVLRDPEHPPRDPHPCAGCAHLPEEWSKESCSCTPSPASRETSASPQLDPAQALAAKSSPWAHPASPQSTTSPKEGRALFPSASTSLPFPSLPLGSRECPQQCGSCPEPGSPSPGQGWLPAPVAAPAHFLLSRSLHFWPSARSPIGPVGLLGGGRHRREQSPTAAPLCCPLPSCEEQEGKGSPEVPKCDPKPGLAAEPALERPNLPKSSILPWRGVPGQGQHPEVLRWQPRLFWLCPGVASAPPPRTGVCHPRFPLWVVRLAPRVTGTAGAQGATESPGWGCRGEELPKELQKPGRACPAEPGPFQEPLATCDKGWHRCAGWKWICGFVMERCCHIPGEPCFLGTLLEPSFPISR